MENRDRDKLNKNTDSSKQSGSDVEFGQKIGRSENVENEPSRKSDSSQEGWQGSSKGSMGSKGSSGNGRP